MAKSKAKPILNGAQILLESLVREGVKDVFGYPGGSVIPLYDILKEYPIMHYQSRHEQGAVHAADGYARATGQAGVCFVTSGPGATNTVTGLATAFMDSVPIVVFSGQVPSPLIGNDAFQEADIVGITRPCTKHSFLCKDVSKLAGMIKQAFYIATTGRPGPVLVDLPKDVFMASTEYDYDFEPKLRGYNPNVSGHKLMIKRAFEAIVNSERPLIYAGGGVISSESASELTKFARKLKIPVTMTLMGLGGFPGTDDLSLGMLGMHGTYRANMAVHDCDCLIAIGARFDDRVTGKVEEFAAGATIIHIDIDPTSISKNVSVNIPIVGDAKQALKSWNDLAAKNPKDVAKLRKKVKPFLKQIKEWKETYPLAYKQSKSKIKPQFVVEKIFEITKGKAIISTEVGQNQMWAVQYFHYDKPRTLLTSGGLGTMGYGFPAAIGAQVAKPNALVIDIAGDGSIQMNIQEMATAIQYHLPIKIVILNNGFLGMVRQWQELFHDCNYASTCVEVAPDFVKLAEAYGAVGLRATKAEDVEKVLKKAFSNGKLTLIDIAVEREENVYPMIPAGGTVNQMILI
jgi:acetolactate synthase I/II/III large subunit